MEDEETGVVFGGMGTGLIMERFWEDEKGRLWRGKTAQL